jgi:hypothetical protein
MKYSDKNRAEAVLVAILTECGTEGLGRTKLYKAFWLAHVYYTKQNAGFLTQWPIVRMPNGPGIDRGFQLLSDLQTHGLIRLSSVSVGPFTEQKATLASNQTCTSLDGPAMDAIRDAVAFVQSQSASELSAFSHDYSRSWNTVGNGEELDIYSDLIPDDEYAVLTRSLEGVEVEALFQ